MKAIVFFILLSSAGTALADAGSCYGINDIDARSYCLARAQGNSAACYSIQDNGLRSMCLAEVRN